MLPWQPEFHSVQPENIMQPFPLPDDASCEIKLRLANWLQRYTLLKVWTTDVDGRRRTPDHAILINGSLEPSAPRSFPGSGTKLCGEAHKNTEKFAILYSLTSILSN